MTETEQAVPFEQRKSQNLTFGDYAKSTLLWAFLPLIGGVSVLTAGIINKKFFNKKAPIIDGSPSLLYHLYEEIFKLGVNKTTGQKLQVDEVERVAFLNRFFPEEKRLDVTHHYWNFTKGLEIAIIPTAFHFWRQKEKVNVSLTPAYDRLKKLGDINPTNEELAADNTSMRKQLEHMHAPKSLPHTKLDLHDAVHHGRTVEHVQEISY